jgi:hypothetical protein
MVRKRPEQGVMGLKGQSSAKIKNHVPGLDNETEAWYIHSDLRCIELEIINVIMEALMKTLLILVLLAGSYVAGMVQESRTQAYRISRITGTSYFQVRGGR